MFFFKTRYLPYRINTSYLNKIFSGVLTKVYYFHKIMQNYTCDTDTVFKLKDIDNDSRLTMTTFLKAPHFRLVFIRY